MSNEALANEQGQEKMNWEDIDASVVRTKIWNEKKKLTALSDELKKLEKDAGNFDNTKTALENIRDQVLGSTGWLMSFYNENIGSFPQAKADAKNPDSRPDWYITYTPDKRKQYDEINSYMVDIGLLQPFMKSMAEVLTQFPLAETYRVLLIARNLNSPPINFTDNAYKKINDDFTAFCNQMTQDWDELEKYAEKSRQYHAENDGKIDPNALKDGYLSARKSDYSAIIKKRAFYDRLYYQGNGLYSLNQDVATVMRGLDQYSAALVKLKSENFETTMDTVINSSKSLIEALQKNTVFKSEHGSIVQSGLLTLVVTVCFFAETSLEEFQKFLQAPNEAPYCMMRQVDALKSPPTNFGFSPKTDDPWNGGTALQEAYKQACVAITLQCREFVNKRGKVTK